MFNNQSIYILEFINLREVRLKNIKENTINKIEFSDEVTLDERIIDQDQFTYLMNKLLVDIDNKSKLLIRYNSDHNIFRYEEVKNLKEEDIDTYLKFNIDEILPFSLDNIEIKANYNNDQLYIYGLNKENVVILQKVFQDMGFSNIYITNFIGELISFISPNNDTFYALNIENSFLELVKIENLKVRLYKLIRNDNNKIDEFNLYEDKNKKFIIDSIAELNLSKNSILYLHGDQDLLNIWINLLNEKAYDNVKEINFNVKNYLGA